MKKLLITALAAILILAGSIFVFAQNNERKMQCQNGTCQEECQNESECQGTCEMQRKCGNGNGCCKRNCQ